MESCRCLSAADLHRREYILLQLPGFHHLASRPSSLRAGTLSITNLIPLFAGPHLSTLADLLGVTLSMFRQIHRSAGVMAVLLAVFHVLVAVASRPSFALDLPQNLLAVIISSWPSCLHPELTPYRACHRCVASPSLSFADPPTNCSSVHTTPWRRSPPTPSGDTCYLTSPFPAATCTSQLECFCSCAPSKAVLSSTRMASSDIAVREPTSRTNIVRSGSAYSVRSHLTSKLGSTLTSGYLPSASSPSCKVTHSW